MDWLGYELHPETPPGGRDLTANFDPAERAWIEQVLTERGRPYGLVFAPRQRSSNSRLALLAGEEARDQRRFEAYHEAIFAAYFRDGRDIGDKPVVLDVAAAAGLDVAALKASLTDGRHLPRLAETRERARAIGLTALPTFVLAGTAGRETLVGAVELAVFRAALTRLSRGGGPQPLLL